MKKNPTIATQADKAQPYIMRIADLLSGDPALVQIIGPRFKVVAYADRKAKRVTYSFRGLDDTEPDEWDLKRV